jgi:hypothetical protein
MSTRRLFVGGALSLALFLGATGYASADQNNGVEEAFLCPIVGDGVIGAPGIEAIDPPAGTSILPGNNQAGQHANANALNSHGDGAPNLGNTPGAEGFTPIWTGAPS